MNLYFTYESWNTLFTLFITAKALAKLNLGHLNKFETEFLKISCRTSRSSRIGHSTLLFCRGRQRNVQRLLLYLPTQIHFLIGGERVTCHWSKLNDALGRTKLNDALGKQHLEL